MPDSSRQEDVHPFPSSLPEGRHFLYLCISRRASENSGLYVGVLDVPVPAQSERRVVVTCFGTTYVPAPDGGSRCGPAVVHEAAPSQVAVAARDVGYPSASGTEGAPFSHSLDVTTACARPRRGRHGLLAILAVAVAGVGTVGLDRRGTVKVTFRRGGDQHSLPPAAATMVQALL